MIDFGIAWAAGATVTRSGLRFGTPSWMAPEQLRDQPAGPPTDVFAWGALVAFAATGRHPFGGGPADAVAYRVLHGRPDLDGVPGAMRQLVREALARDPAARPTADRVVAILAAASPPTRPLPAGDPTWVLPAMGGGNDGSMSADLPRAMAAGPTRRRRRRRGRAPARRRRPPRRPGHGAARRAGRRRGSLRLPQPAPGTRASSAPATRGWVGSRGRPRAEEADEEDEGGEGRRKTRS